MRFKLDGGLILVPPSPIRRWPAWGSPKTEANQQGVACEITRFDLAELGLGHREQPPNGVSWKVLTPPRKDTLLGVTIVAARPGELLAEFVLAMKWNLGLGKIMGAIHAYPTMAEANKYAAGVWKKAHAPQRTLAWLKRYHDFRRSR